MSSCELRASGVEAVQAARDDGGLGAALDLDRLVDGELVAAGDLGDLGDDGASSARASPTLTGEMKRTLSRP